jgi:hypothetical protein
MTDALLKYDIINAYSSVFPDTIIDLLPLTRVRVEGIQQSHNHDSSDLLRIFTPFSKPSPGS